MKYEQRIKDLRTDNDLSQETVAKHLKTTQQYYGTYERGERQLSLDRAIELAKFYNVSLDYLAGITDIKENQEVKTQKHKRIIAAYERNKDMQKAVDKLLDIK